MIGAWIFQTLLFLTILTIIAFALGEYMAQVFSGEKNILSPILMPVEKGVYKLFGVNPADEMHWKTYVTNLLLFNLIGIIAIFLLQEIQQWLPFNPQNLGAVRWDRAINTAISYTTNTNWQAYKGETALSYLTQMLGLGLQNFLSAATGIAVGVAFITGFSRRSAFTLGNFWVDLTRAILYLLLPLAIILALLLISQGVIQNLHPYVLAHTLQGGHNQLIAQGPAAARIAIKHLGTNGGGFFNANSAHPYENPTPFSDYLEIFGMLIIAASFPFAFGAMIGNRKQGWAIFLAMLLLFIGVLSMAMIAEFHGNPLLEKIGIHHGINMEGKEVRFGPLSSVVFSMATTATSTGAVNSMHGSFMPLSILVMIFNMASGEVIFGGVGSGFIGMLLYAILSMFLIGLMIGRSPEIYGKKLEPREMVITCIALLLPPVIQLILGAIAAATPSAVASTSTSLPHGLTEIIYTYASGMGNNGSSLNGLNADTVFYNLTTGFAMLAGRALSLVAPLAIAGFLAQKNIIPAASRFPTASSIFVIILACMVIVIGALTFLPVLVIGPILEHFSLYAGKLL